jgi:chemotaxis protein MotB
MNAPRVFVSLIRRPLVLGLAVAPLALGCQSAMYEENYALHSQARQLQENNKALRGELGTRPDAAQLASLQSELAAKEQRIADLESQLQERLLAPDLETGLLIPGVDGVEISLDDVKGEMTMRVPGDLLFASGSSNVSKAAGGTLSRIAEIINSDYAGKTVRVEGHTDSDPIKKSAGKFDSNRDLSLRRAYAVTKALTGQGVSGDRIETVGHGEHRSLGKGKKTDRRVEIIVVM